MTRQTTAPPTAAGMHPTTTLPVSDETVRPLRASVSLAPSPPVSSRGQTCDRCRTATAKAEVRMPSGVLYLCGHHLLTHWDLLRRSALAIEVDDPGTAFLFPREKLAGAVA